MQAATIQTPTDADPTLERRSLHTLLGQLRRYQQGRVAVCGMGVAYGQCEVEIQCEDGHARFAGIFRCGSVWSCPVCALRIHAQRAAEVAQAIHWWGMDRVILMTLTLRHQAGNDLRWLSRQLSKAWIRVQQSRWWRGTRDKKSGEYLGGFKQDVGIEHTIRVSEVTHGSNGWHPHLHMALFVRNPGELDLETNLERLREQWSRVVSSMLGRTHEPNDHGAHLGPCHREDYLTKLGLEIAWSRSKTGRGRTIWELMADLARTRSARDAALWREYSEAYKGQRQLTWSLGLKKLSQVPEVSDQQIADDGDAATGTGSTEVLAIVPKETWMPFAKHPRAVASLIRLVEGGGGIVEVGNLFAKVLSVDRSLVVFDRSDRRLRWKRDN